MGDTRISVGAVPAADEEHDMSAEQKVQDRITELEHWLATISVERDESPYDDGVEEAYQSGVAELRALWSELGGLQA